MYKLKWFLTPYFVSLLRVETEICIFLKFTFVSFPLETFHLHISNAIKRHYKCGDISYKNKLKQLVYHHRVQLMCGLLGLYVILYLFFAHSCQNKRLLQLSYKVTVKLAVKTGSVFHFLHKKLPLPSQKFHS